MANLDRFGSALLILWPYVAKTWPKLVVLGRIVDDARLPEDLLDNLWAVFEQLWSSPRSRSMTFHDTCGEHLLGGNLRACSLLASTCAIVSPKSSNAPWRSALSNLYNKC